MRMLTILLILLLSSCTIYKVKTERDDTGLLTSNVTVLSTRNFKRVGGGYVRAGADASFDFAAEGVSQPIAVWRERPGVLLHDGIRFPVSDGFYLAGSRDPRELVRPANSGSLPSQVQERAVPLGIASRLVE